MSFEGEDTQEGVEGVKGAGKGKGWKMQINAYFTGHFLSPAQNNVAMQYNTQPQLWGNYFRLYPEAKVTVNDGHVYIGGDCLARFADSASAISTLVAAGCNARNITEKGGAA